MELITGAIKVRQLRHDLTCDAASIRPTRVLDGRSLRVGGERENKHSPAGSFGQLESGRQRTDAQVGR